MKTPTVKPDRSNTYHRDGTVSFWAVHAQQWKRYPAANIPTPEIATMCASEIRKITKHADTR
jgi:hypothetical protein